MGMEEYFDFDNTLIIEEVYSSKEEDLLALPLSDDRVACIGLASLLHQIASQYDIIEWVDMHSDATAGQRE